MNSTLKIGAFAGGLAVVFAGALAVGIASRSTDPRPAARAAHKAMEPEVNSHETGHGPDPAASSSAKAALPGLAVSQDGYTLLPQATELPPGRVVPFRFTIAGPDGAPVLEYRVEHEKELHLIVVRRDFAGFQHVHPVRGSDGAWSVPLELTRAGTYRVFADFTPAALGRGLTLGADVAVGGPYDPAVLPAATNTATVDGYEVSLRGAPVAGRESELTFTVTRNGAKVTDLQPYLGAFGHLVSLRVGDLAYLHTHPSVEAAAGERGGPGVTFSTGFPTAGHYRLFLDFKHREKVHTAAFTVTATALGAGAES